MPIRRDPHRLARPGRPGHHPRGLPGPDQGGGRGQHPAGGPRRPGRTIQRRLPGRGDQAHEGQAHEDPPRRGSQAHPGADGKADTGTLARVSGGHHKDHARLRGHRARQRAH
jgi:hypothetical protein